MAIPKRAAMANTPESPVNWVIESEEASVEPGVCSVE